MGREVLIAVTGGTLDFARGGGPANGKSIAFSGDTDVCEGLVEAARDANLAVFESSFPDGQKAVGHLTPGEAGEIASRSNAERLLLTHFYPECEGEDIFVQCRRSTGVWPLFPPGGIFPHGSG
jgi:ribonuclease BN (tRNA processing enzyme)